MKNKDQQGSRQAASRRGIDYNYRWTLDWFATNLLDDSEEVATCYIGSSDVMVFDRHTVRNCSYLEWR